MSADILTVALAGGLVYYYLQSRPASDSQPQEPTDAIPIIVPEGKVMATTIGEIVVYDGSFTPQTDTLYWVNDRILGRVVLRMYQVVTEGGVPVSSKWVDCVIGELVIAPVVGDKGEPGLPGAPGDSSTRKIVNPSFTVASSSATTTVVAGAGSAVQQGVAETLVFDIMMAATFLASTGTVVAQVMTGTTVLATFALSFNAAFTWAQFGRAQVTVPPSGATRDLVVKVSTKQASSYTVGASYVSS